MSAVAAGTVSALSLGPSLTATSGRPTASRRSHATLVHMSAGWGTSLLKILTLAQPTRAPAGRCDRAAAVQGVAARANVRRYVAIVVGAATGARVGVVASISPVGESVK